MREEFVSILEALDESALSGYDFRQLAMDQLSFLDEYKWSGVYVLVGETLFLDAYNGDSPEHKEIPVGRGVCGSAVSENRNKIIEDVRSESNYLACSVLTRSEIVVLIKQNDEILGQIDIDGHKVGAFTSEDEAFLSQMAQRLADRWD